MRVVMTQTGAEAIADDFLVSGLSAGARALGVTRHYGQLLVTQIQANASGRPGPNVVTGDYRRSWSVRFGVEGNLFTGMPWAEASTNKPQGRRLELGFEDVDSLGREYHQPPFPHVGPALDSIAPRYQVALAAGVLE